MARVYVSSTSEDLAECRAAVFQALRRLERLGVEAVGMEDYNAGTERPLDDCLADVGASDIYVGILAWRRGFVPPGETRSIVELEYRAALDAGKEVAMFLLHEDAPWPRSLVDRGDAADQVERFRSEVSLAHRCRFFSTAHELAGLVVTSVSELVADGPAAAAEQSGIDQEVLAGYYTRLEQHYGRLDLDALTPPQREEYLQIALSEVFVEQSVRDDPPPVELPKDLWQKLTADQEIDEQDLPEDFDLVQLRAARDVYRAKPSRRALDVIADGAPEGLVLLGDPGAGKSTLARYLVLALGSPAVPDVLEPLQGRVPILIELRGFAALQRRGRCTTFLDYLDVVAETDGLGLPRVALEPFLEAGGQALFVFDGLDEVFDPEEREGIARQIANLRTRYPASAVLATSRIIGYRRGTLGDAGFAHATVQDLDVEQIGAFLDGWYALALHDRPADAAMRKERLMRAIESFPAIRDLAGNPLLLTILAIIGKHQELPQERWRVYDHAAAVLVEHWDVNRHLSDRSVSADFIGQEDKKELLRRVAFRMQAGAGGLAGNYIAGRDLQAEFEDYLTTRYRRDAADAKVIATAMIEQFRERNFVLSRYGADVYGFVHRAFLEHFCATAIVARFEKSRELTFEDLRDEVFGRHWEDPAWREVLRLIAGTIDERFAGQLVRYLVEDVYRPWPLDFGDRPPQNIVLAAECLSELRNPQAVEAEARLVLTAIVELLEHQVLIVSGQDATSRAGDAVLAPALAVGPGWPGRELFLEWYERRGRRIAWAPMAKHSALIAAALSDDPLEIFVRGAAAAEEAADTRLIDAVMSVAERHAAPGERWTAALSRWREQAAERTDEVLDRVGQPAGVAGARDGEYLFRASASYAATTDAIGSALGGDAEAAKTAVGLLTVDESLGLVRRLITHRQDDAAASAFSTVSARFRGDPRVQACAAEIMETDCSQPLREAAIEATSWSEIPDGFDRLVELVETSDELGTRLAVSVALADLSAEVGLLAWLAARLPRADSRRVLMASARRIKDGMSLEEAVEGLSEHPDVDVRRSKPLARLLKTSPGGESDLTALDELSEWLAEAGPSRRLLESAVARTGTLAEAMTSLVEFVDAPTSPVWKILALRSLEPEVPEALEVARLSLEDPHEAVAAEAIEAIGRASNGALEPSDVAELRGLALSDTRSTVASRAAAALANLPERHRRELEEIAAGAPSVATRTAAIRGLGTLASAKPSVPLLTDLLDDDEPAVRVAAIQALAQVWTYERNGFETLHPLAASDPDSDVRLAALWQLSVAWPGDERLRDLADQLLEDPDGAVRQAALHTLLSGWDVAIASLPSHGAGDGVFWSGPYGEPRAR